MCVREPYDIGVLCKLVLGVTIMHCIRNRVCYKVHRARCDVWKFVLSRCFWGLLQELEEFSE